MINKQYRRGLASTSL